ncbi:CRE-GLR-4 protein, partial [Aphelenchoides avenae]
ILSGVESIVWHNVRHAVDQWNNEFTVQTGITLNLVTSSDTFAAIDDRFCDIAQRYLVAIIVPSEAFSREQLHLTLSMCNRFHIPCITTASHVSLNDTRFVTTIGPGYGMVAKATAQLIASLTWNSFVLVYQQHDDLYELVDLLSVWYNQLGATITMKVLQLPKDQVYFDAFLKYTRERLRQTNMVVHTADIGTINALLSHASALNMTDNRHSYLFTNPVRFFMGPS